jgi:hypothetical protein
VALANASTGIPSPDFVLDLDTTYRTKFDPIGYLGAVGVFPGFGSEEFIVRATLTKAAGERLRTHEAAGELKVVRHLLFVPLAPLAAFLRLDLFDDTFSDVLIPIAQDLAVATEGGAASDGS